MSCLSRHHFWHRRHTFLKRLFKCLFIIRKQTKANILIQFKRFKKCQVCCYTYVLVIFHVQSFGWRHPLSWKQRRFRWQDNRQTNKQTSFCSLQKWSLCVLFVIFRVFQPLMKIWLWPCGLDFREKYKKACETVCVFITDLKVKGWRDEHNICCFSSHSFTQESL